MNVIIPITALHHVLLACLARLRHASFNKHHCFQLLPQ